MIYAVKICAILFAVLHIAAAASRLREKEKKDLDTAAIMAAGSAVMAASAAMLSFAWLSALLGGAIVCAAAVMNGRRSGKLNPVHHIVRGILVVLITAGYVIFG